MVSSRWGWTWGELHLLSCAPQRCMLKANLNIRISAFGDMVFSQVTRLN